MRTMIAALGVAALALGACGAPDYGKPLGSIPASEAVNEGMTLEDVSDSQMMKVAGEAMGCITTSLFPPVASDNTLVVVQDGEVLGNMDGSMIEKALAEDSPPDATEEIEAKVNPDGGRVEYFCDEA